MYQQTETLERGFISAKFLRADAAPTVVEIPEGFVVTQCPTKVARGARRNKSHAVDRTVGMAPQQDLLRNLAARGW